MFSFVGVFTKILTHSNVGGEGIRVDDVVIRTFYSVYELETKLNQRYLHRSAYPAAVGERAGERDGEGVGEKA